MTFKGLKLTLAAFIAIAVFAISDPPSYAGGWCDDHPTYQSLMQENDAAMDDSVAAGKAVQRAQRNVQTKNRLVQLAMTAAATSCVAVPASCWSGATAVAAAILAYEDAVANLQDAQEDYADAVRNYQRANQRLNDWYSANCVNNRYG